MLNGLDLFSGIGGISLALSPWVRPVAYCENEPYARSVLLSRMVGGDLYPAPIWDDVRTLRGDLLPEVDIIAGGFPCQDISEAGAGAGLDGERSGLVFDAIRLIGECRPAFAFLENVPAIDLRGLDRILLELDALGYDARWTVVSAGEVGALHDRPRWWLLAHAHGEQGRLPAEGRPEVAEARRRGSAGALSRSSAWMPEPRVDRAGYGIPKRVDRGRVLGNSVVPQCARKAFMRLIGLDGSLTQQVRTDD